MAKVLKTVAIVAVAVAVVVFAPQIAGVLASVAGSLGVTVAASAISSALIGMGISMALTAAATMFRKAPSMSQSLVDRLNTSVVPTGSRKIVFGTTAAGQDVRFFEGDVDLPNSKKDGYVQVIALASHRISAFRDFYVENDLVWSNGTFLKHRGGFAPNNPFRVVAEGKPGNGFSVGSGRFWNSTSTFTGCAYYVPFWKLDDKIWESGIPQRLTAIVDGCPLYDPRRDSTRGGSGSHRAGNQDTYAFRDGAVELGRNPALALLTYLLGWRINGKLVWGMGIPAHRIDFDNFRTYANLCEERVATQAGGTVQRYTVDGIFSTTDSHETIINGVTAAMGSCKLTDRGGTYCLVGGYDDTAGPKISFTADDLVAPANGSSPYIWNPAPPSRERYNIVRGRFANPDELYQLADWGDPIEQPPLADGIPRTLSIDLGAVSRAETCQRIAKQFLLREYLTPGMFSATFGPKAFAVEIGSVITLSLPAEGWNNKLFRVMEQAETHDLFFQMTLREEDPQVYAWDREEKPLPLSIRPQGYDASATISPANVALTSASYSGANGVNVSEVHVAWTPELSGRVSGIQIQSRPQGSDAWTEQAALFDPKLGTFTFTSNAPGVTVEVQARFRMSSAVYSPWVIANVETAAVETIDTTARDNAGSALDKADKAQGTATSAKDTAETAKGTADTAQKTADEAKKALQDDKGVIIKASDLRKEIEAVKDSYGGSEGASAAQKAAEAARDTAKIHADNSKQASDQSAAARDGADRALAGAEAKRDAADKSAAVADASKIAAQTAKGQAEAAQGKAAASESNASGSASSAAAKEALTASTYRAVITATGNEQFNNGTDGWDGLGASALVASSAGRSNVIRTPVGATYHAVQGRKVPVTSADQRFELRSSLRCAAGQSVYYVGAIFYDADDKLVEALDGTGNYALGSGYAVDSATNNNWVDREVVIGKGLNVKSEYGGTRNIPTATVYFRPCIYINYLSNAASITEVDYYTVADVTSQQKAASSAAAASVSASNAAASETVAGQKASAASGSADTASTKAGEANGSASRAAVSERNAEGSKNSASSSAALAAKSFTDTVRINRNDDFEQGTEGWRHSPTEGYLASATWEPARNVAGRASTLKQRNAGDDYLYADYLVPIASGRSYQFETSYFVENGSGTSLQYLGFQCIGADGNYIGGNTGHFYWSSPTSNAGAGWANYKSVVYVAGKDLPAGTTHIRPLILYNYLNNTNLGPGYVDYIRCLDVTESEMAAGSAAASTQQASTATTKATEAGQSAAAANSSRADAANLAADARREAKSASDQAAIATDKASAASSSQTLAATFASKLAAMNLDSEMERDVAVNDCWSSSPTVFSGVDARMTKTIAWDNVSCLFWPASIGGATVFSRAAVQVDPRRTYRISCRIGAYLNGSSGAANRFYIGFVGLNAAGQGVDHGSYGSFRYSALVGGVLTDGQISEFSANVTGEGNDSWVKFPPGTKQVRLCIIMNYDNGPTHSYIDYVRFEDVTDSVTANASAQVAAAQAATATAQAAAAQRSAVLSASLSGGLIGLNTKFADYPDSHYSSAPPGWAVWSSGSALRRTYGNGSLSDPNPLSIEGSPWGINMVNPGSGDGSAGIYQEVRATGGRYVIEATAELGDGGWNGSGVLLYALDANKSYLGQSWIDFTNEADINGTTANTIANIYKVRRFSKPVTVPGGTNCAYIRVYAMTGWTGFTGASNYKYMTWYKCGIRPASNAEAKVETHDGAIANLQAKTATAWSEKTVSVPGAEAAIRMIATNANGVPTANIALVAPQIALFNTANGQVLPTFKAEGGNVSIAGDLRGGAGRIIFDNGSVMKVSGTGFGSRGQFIEWFGPRQDNLANCTEANASYYLKTDGSSYFGGSLSAGVLKNSVQTTSLAADANVTTGIFGSNGRSRVVTVGYNMSGNTGISGGCPAPYTPYAVVRLYRGTNSGGTLLVEQQFNGSHQCEAGQGQYEPGYYSDNIGGSFTYTDNSGGGQASYYVQIVGRYTGVLNQQSLGVTSVEQ